MKKILSIMLILMMSLGLCACAEAEETVLPGKQEQITDETQQAAGEESLQATESDEGKHPWEIEFREEDYVRFEGKVDNKGDVITWKENNFLGQTRRNLYLCDNGDVEDVYYYSSGAISHEIIKGADGSYREVHWLEDGVVVFWLQTEADGLYEEAQYTEDGNEVFSIMKKPDGYYQETRYYENGNLSELKLHDPASDIIQEEEYFENGTAKSLKMQTGEYTTEEHFDEEGYHLYYNWKQGDFALELIADESGKLIKIIENGEVIEDPDIMAQYATSYNFRQ